MTLNPKSIVLKWFFVTVGCKRVNCNKIDGDRPRLPANRNCHMLSRVSWASAHISCFKYWLLWFINSFFSNNSLLMSSNWLQTNNQFSANSIYQAIDDGAQWCWITSFINNLFTKSLMCQQKHSKLLWYFLSGFDVNSKILFEKIRKVENCIYFYEQLKSYMKEHLTWGDLKITTICC